jgi:hypothetical protein
MKGAAYVNDIGQAYRDRQQRDFEHDRVYRESVKMIPDDFYWLKEELGNYGSFGEWEEAYAQGWELLCRGEERQSMIIHEWNRIRDGEDIISRDAFLAEYNVEVQPLAFDSCEYFEELIGPKPDWYSGDFGPGGPVGPAGTEEDYSEPVWDCYTGYLERYRLEEFIGRDPRFEQNVDFNTYQQILTRLWQMFDAADLDGDSRVTFAEWLHLQHAERADESSEAFSVDSTWHMLVGEAEILDRNMYESFLSTEYESIRGSLLDSDDIPSEVRDWL